MSVPTAKVVNITSARVELRFARGPGEAPDVRFADGFTAIDIPAGYAERLSASQPSIVENLTQGRVLPADDPRAQQVLAMVAARAAAANPLDPAS